MSEAKLLELAQRHADENQLLLGILGQRAITPALSEQVEARGSDAWK